MSALSVLLETVLEPQCCRETTVNFVVSVMAKELCRFATSVPDNVQRKDARTNERMPLVILFGWIGSEERYLAKYSTFYSEKG